MSRVMRLIKAGIRADRNRIKRDIKVAFPVNWPSMWVLPLMVFLLSSIFMCGNLGNYQTKITLGLLKDNPSNWNYFTQNGELYRFLTYSIIHNNLTHYLSNMVSLLVLWMISIVEKQKRVKRTYILAVVLGGLAQLHFTTANQAIGIGASAGTKSLAGLYLGKMIKEKNWTLAFLFLFVSIVDDFIQISQNSQSSVIGSMGHLCGLLIGIAFGMFNFKNASEK